MDGRETKLNWAKILLIVIGLSIATNMAVASGSPKVKTIKRRQYLLLKDIAANYDMSIQASAPDVIAIEDNRDSIQIYPGQRKTVFRGTEVWLNGDLEKSQGRWYLPKVDQRDILDPLLDPAKHLKGYDCDTVVLDPGHGGRDPGAVSANGLTEKWLTLDIAKRISGILESKGITVHLTRNRDKYLQLGFRPRIAKKKNGDIFLSIHINSAETSQPRGVETYRLTASGFPSVQEEAGEAIFKPSKYNGNGYNGANTLLGFNIQRSLQKATRSPDRGLRHARYAVLKTAPCPAVLVECGFLNNPSEEKKMRDPSYRDRIATGIASGILQYRSEIERAKLLANPLDPE